MSFPFTLSCPSTAGEISTCMDKEWSRDQTSVILVSFSAGDRRNSIEDIGILSDDLHGSWEYSRGHSWRQMRGNRTQIRRNSILICYAAHRAMWLPGTTLVMSCSTRFCLVVMERGNSWFFFSCNISMGKCFLFQRSMTSIIIINGCCHNAHFLNVS